MDKYALFALTFVMASFAGLAALLRSGEILKVKRVVSAMLNSGLLGLVILLIWYNQNGPENVWFLMGISILAGLGGNSAIDLCLTLAKRIIESKAGVKDDPKP